MECKETKLTLKDLFNGKKLIVPPYQRAYAWEEPQLKQFVADLLEIVRRGGYYYGHFILEERNDSFEIIDGQQRITTFILFLMICKSLGAKDVDNDILQFETVNYDKEAFEKLQLLLHNGNQEDEIKLPDMDLQTLSIQRIIFALNYFRKLFDGIHNSGLKLDPTEISNYIVTLTNAHISTHITKSKAVAVQIFELQNTRGVKLNLIEKVKSKFMKHIYLNGKPEENDDVIQSIQKDFAEIYRCEENVSANNFRGDLKLDDILFFHLRMIDDGSKLNPQSKAVFDSPGYAGTREETILNYIDEKLASHSTNVVHYIIKLVARFKGTVEFISNDLPKKDSNNSLIGDVLILDKILSLQFFILLHHIELEQTLEDSGVLKLWEKLLYTRDFHDEYKRKWYGDDFERLYYDAAKNAKSSQIKVILERYIKNGFREELEGILPDTVSKYIENNEKAILYNAFNWWQGKMVYLLYKYEIDQKACLPLLRKIMKEGRSIEHILPQSWELVWINEIDRANISEDGKRIIEDIERIINGIGNLLLITPSENSSMSNKHPKDKSYTSCSRGSYSKHEGDKEKWKDYTKWKDIINGRGDKILNFLKEFVL